MKKYILLLAFATMVTSCKKMYPNGNLGVFKLKDSIVRYSDENAPKPTYVKKDNSGKIVKPNLIEPDLMLKKVTTEVAAKPIATK